MFWRISFSVQCFGHQTLHSSGRWCSRRSTPSMTRPTILSSSCTTPSYAMSMIGMLLGGGMSSRLFQRVREELGLAYSVYSFQSFHEDAGTHGVYVGTTPETARAAVDAINDELEKLSSSGLSEEDLVAGKSQLKGQITLSLESPTSRMYRAAGVELYGGTYKKVDEVLA